MKWLMIILIPLVFVACKSDDKAFNDAECMTLSDAQDTIQIGLAKYWIETSFLGDGQVKILLRSDNQVDIDQIETDFIQMSNRFGCYQTGNSKKFFGIDEDYYIYNEISPSYTISGTNIKVRFTLPSKDKVDLLGAPL